MLERLLKGWIKAASILAVSLFRPVVSETCVNEAGALQECQYNTCPAAAWTVPTTLDRISLGVSEPPPWSVKYFDDFKSHQSLMEWIDFISNPLYGDPVTKSSWRVYWLWNSRSLAGKSESNLDIVRITLERHGGIESEKKPSALIVANWHGDERISRQFALNLIEYFRTQRGAQQSTEPTALDDFDIHIVPVANPDGFQSNTWHNSKNKDILWGFPLTEAAALSCDPIGAQESKAICTIHETIRPTVTVAFAADRSIPSIQFPSGCSTSFEEPDSAYSCASTPLSDIFEGWADSYIGPFSQDSQGLFSADACGSFAGRLPFSEIPPSSLMPGEPGHYLDFALQQGSLPLLVDMARRNESDLASPAISEGFPETEQLDQLFEGHLVSLTKALGQVFEYCVAVRVTDIESKALLKATIQIYAGSTSLPAFASSGFVTRIVPHGLIRVSAESPGYTAKEVSTDHQKATEKCNTVEIELKKAPQGSIVPTPFQAGPPPPPSGYNSDPPLSIGPGAINPTFDHSPPPAKLEMVSFSLYFPGLYPSPRNVDKWSPLQFEEWLESNILSSDELYLQSINSIDAQVVELCGEDTPPSIGCESVASLTIESQASQDNAALRTNGTALQFEGQEVSAGGLVVLLSSGPGGAGSSTTQATSSPSSSPGQIVLYASLGAGISFLAFIVLVILRRRTRKRKRQKGLNTLPSSSFQRATRSQKVACLNSVGSDAQGEGQQQQQQLTQRADTATAMSKGSVSVHMENVQTVSSMQLPIAHAPAVLPPLREEQDDAQGYGGRPGEDDDDDDDDDYDDDDDDDNGGGGRGASGRRREKRSEIDKRVTRRWKHARSHWTHSENLPQQSQPHAEPSSSRPDDDLDEERCYAWS